MLNRLLIEGHPAHVKREIVFAPGLTAIVGPNESGKSSILECISAALWGTEAWRSNADDYKKTTVQLDFAPGGVPYSIFRRGAKVELKLNGEVIATGTKPVNSHIRRLLGYNFDVYKVANYCAQDEIQALCNMKPTARRAMIDSVVGIDTLEKVAAHAAEQSLGFQRQAEALEKVIVPPQEPIKPETYMPSATIAENIAAWRKIDAERVDIVAFLKNPPAVPEAPNPPCAETVAQLQPLVEARNALVAQEKVLQRQTDSKLTEPTPVATLEAAERAWAAYHLWEEKSRALRGVVKPTYSRDQIADVEKAWSAYDLYKMRLELEKGATTCPQCGHQWSQDQHWAQVKEAPPAEQPKLSRRDIQQELQRLDNWDATADTRARYAEVKEAAKPTLTEQAIRDQRALHATYDERKKRVDELADLRRQIAATPDKSALLQQRMQYDAAVQAHQAAVQAKALWEEAAEAKRERLEEIGDPQAQINAYEAMRTEALRYEGAMATYENAKRSYEAAVMQREKHLQDAADWRRGRDALRDLRQRYKAYIIPSLSKSASALLQSMTGGQRQQINVTEDVEVTVDNHTIEQLSGSTKAVANLALRIGLGQVLTKNTFSVFIGDELDGSMDHSRASLTSETLRSLTNVFDQVILVSHKAIAADQVIDLGQ